MKLSPDAVRQAVATHLKADWAERLDLSGLIEDDGIPNAFVPIFGYAALALELVSVALYRPPNEPITLGPQEALSHQLMRDWLQPTLGAALGAPMLAGVRELGLAEGSPIWRDVTIEDRGDGVFSGSATYLFESAKARVHVTAVYGDHDHAPAVRAPLHLDGVALVNAGRDARRLSHGQGMAPAQINPSPRRRKVH